MRCSLLVAYLLLLSISAMAGCGPKPLPPPPEPEPLPDADTPEEYLKLVSLEDTRLILGVLPFEDDLHWLCAGRVINHGARAIKSVTMETVLVETDYKSKAKIIDPFTRGPLGPGEDAGFTVSAGFLEQGVPAEKLEQGKTDYPPPPLKTRLTSLEFAE